jgi:hypothetical protein
MGDADKYSVVWVHVEAWPNQVQGDVAAGSEDMGLVAAMPPCVDSTSLDGDPEEGGDEAGGGATMLADMEDSEMLVYVNAAHFCVIGMVALTVSHNWRNCVRITSFFG